MFFRRRKLAAGPPAASAPDGVVIWAIGDVHGQSDLLGALLEPVVDDLLGSTVIDRQLVLLGDYVDRGLGAREVLDQLVALQEFASTNGITVHALKGNHDDFLLRFLAEPSVGPEWIAVGGAETLIAYGVQAPAPTAAEEQWQATAEALAEAIPRKHVEFLESLEMSHTIGDYHFVHAGVRPDVPLDAQAPEDAMWIRARFLDDPRRLEKVVVHGHTPSPAFHQDHRRVGLDTGAYATGVLTAMRFQGTSRSLLQTRRRGQTVDILSRDL
jgi:serine/threonine protein phosphatase 1